MQLQVPVVAAPKEGKQEVKENSNANAPAKKEASPAPVPSNSNPVDDYSKLNIKVAKVVSVKRHPEADKLFVCEVDVGGEMRQLCTGLVGYIQLCALKYAENTQKNNF